MKTAATRTPRLTTFSEAGVILGIDRKMVAQIARRNGIVPKHVPWNGLAKGLDDADMEVIRAAWSRMLVPARSRNP